MNEARLKVPVTERDHYRGPLRSPVTMVEYGDFQCPYCAQAFPEVEQLFNEFHQQMCFAYRHFPLSNLHPYAELAALASEAADQQGQFWPMHHTLYRIQPILSEQTIFAAADDLGLNMDEFQRDLTREDLLERIRDDMNGGIRSGVNGTPTLFFNGVRYDGPSNHLAWRQYVQRLLDQGVTSGVTW